MQNFERPFTPKTQYIHVNESYTRKYRSGCTKMGGKRLDRYIPQGMSKKAYRSSPSLKKFDLRETELLTKSPSPEKLSSPDFFSNLRTTGHYESINHDTSNISSAGTLDTTGGVDMDKASVVNSKLPYEQRKHREFIADSLGFQNSQRVLMFHSSHMYHNNDCLDVEEKLVEGVPGNKGMDEVFGQSHHYLRIDPLTSKLDPDKAIRYLATTAFSEMKQSMSFVSNHGVERPSKRVRSQIPYRVLDAPSLRNDYYSNLISWSKRTDNIMVGLGCSVYIWSDFFGAIPVLDHEYLGSKNDLVTCVSFCPVTNYFVIGTKQGRILLFDQQLYSKNYQKNNAMISPLYEFQTETLRGISCIEWSQKGLVSKLFVGEESGIVMCLAIDNQLNSTSDFVKNDISSISMERDQQGRFISATNQSPSERSKSGYHRLVSVFRFQAQSQQVCGISLHQDEQQLAIGGNDNSCTLWDISVTHCPKLCFILPHGAAVKAVTFCPWSKSLLATGAGSKDRKIRFWHTKTGTLLDEIQTGGQVTSLIWSARQKQIVATFGFCSNEDPVLLTLYSYPRLVVLRTVRSPTPLRVLSAVSSPNMTSICVAANDETIRFYELWDEKDNVINEAQEKGIYSSSIIDYMEGIYGSHSKPIR